MKSDRAHFARDIPASDAPVPHSAVIIALCVCAGVKRLVLSVCLSGDCVYALELSDWFCLSVCLSGDFLSGAIPPFTGLSDG